MKGGLLGQSVLVVSDLPWIKREAARPIVPPDTRAYKQTTMSFQTRGDEEPMKLFLAV